MPICLVGFAPVSFILSLQLTLCIDCFRIIRSTVEMLADDLDIVINTLKLMSELVENKCQRLNFDVASANGLILFKEASIVLQIYGMLVVCYTFSLFRVGLEKAKASSRRKQNV